MMVKVYKIDDNSYQVITLDDTITPNKSIAITEDSLTYSEVVAYLKWHCRLLSIDEIKIGMAALRHAYKNQIKNAVSIYSDKYFMYSTKEIK